MAYPQKVVNGKKHMENSVVIAGKNIQHQRWKLQRMQIKHILQQPSGTCGEPGNHGSFKGRISTFKVTGQSKGITWSQQHEGCGSKCQWQSDGKGYRHSQSNIESKQENICLHRLRKSMKKIERRN